MVLLEVYTKKTKSKKKKNGRIMLLSKCEVRESNLSKEVELVISK